MNLLTRRVRRAEIFCLSAIVLLAFGLRLFLLQDRMFWYGDMGRDALIANQIVTQNLRPLVGHTASGFSPVFYYPPYYYYLLSIFSSLTNNPIVLTSIFVIFQSLFIILLYHLYKSFSGSMVALLASFFYAVSSAAIQAGSSVWPVYIMPIFFYLGLKLTNGRPDEKLYAHRLLGHAILIFSTTIHYSSMPLVFLLEVRDIFILIKRGRNDRAIAFIVFLYFIFTLLYFPLITSLGLSETLYSFFSPHNIFLNPETLKNFFYHMHASWGGLFSSKTAYLIGSYVFVIGVGTLFFTKTYVHLRKNVFALVAFVIFCFSLSLKPGELIPFWNYTILFPLFIFVVACLCVDLIKNIYTPIRLIGIFCSALFALALINNFSSYRYPAHDFPLGETVSKVIYDDAVRRDYFPNIYVAADEPYSKNLFDRYRLWYFLEKIHKGFVVYDDASYGLTQSLTGDWPYYLACEKAKSYDINCVNSFLKSFSSYTEIARIDVAAHDVIIHLFLPGVAPVAH